MSQTVGEFLAEVMEQLAEGFGMDRRPQLTRELEKYGSLLHQTDRSWFENRMKRLDQKIEDGSESGSISFLNEILERVGKMVPLENDDVYTAFRSEARVALRKGLGRT